MFLEILDLHVFDKIETTVLVFKYIMHVSSSTLNSVCRYCSIRMDWTVGSAESVAIPGESRIPSSWLVGNTPMESSHEHTRRVR